MSLNKKAKAYRIKHYEKFDRKGKRKVEYIYAWEVEGDYIAGAKYIIKEIEKYIKDNNFTEFEDDMEVPCLKCNDLLHRLKELGKR